MIDLANEEQPRFKKEFGAAHRPVSLHRIGCSRRENDRVSPTIDPHYVGTRIGRLIQRFFCTNHCDEIPSLFLHGFPPFVDTPRG